MNSSPEEVLFALALEKPAENRPAFLDAVCEGDTALRQRLDALLAAHDQPETLLATQADTARPTIKLDLADAPARCCCSGRVSVRQRSGADSSNVRCAEQDEPRRRCAFG